MDYERDEYGVHLIVDHRVDARYDPANLWPEPWREAARRNQLKISLNHKVCAGTMSLAKAQGETVNPARGAAMSRRFLITPGYQHETLPSPFEVMAASVEAATDIAWRMLHTQYLPAKSWSAFTVVRVTGRLGERGWFQLYRHMPDAQHPSRTVRFDSAFHVQPHEGATDPGSFREAQREFADPPRW
jgi:hypothetical protein